MTVISSVTIIATALAHPALDWYHCDFYWPLIHLHQLIGFLAASAVSPASTAVLPHTVYSIHYAAAATDGEIELGGCFCHSQIEQYC